MIKIVTDSTVQLSQEEIDQYNITIVPLSVMIDGTVYLDNVTITKEKFMDKMSESASLPTTSQPSVGSYVEVYDKLGADGSQVLSIHATGDLSGTYSAAVQGAQLSPTDVTVVDSRFIDRPLAHQVLTAAEMIEEGQSMDIILERLKELQKETTFYIGIVTLENLIKGGRISHTMGKISNFLNLKLMLQMTDKEGLTVETKGRGLKSLTKRIDKIVEEMSAAAPLKEIGITHVGLTTYSEKIIDKMTHHFPETPIHLAQASPVLMTHAGKGAFAITYLKKKGVSL